MDVYIQVQRAEILMEIFINKNTSAQLLKTM